MESCKSMTFAFNAKVSTLLLPTLTLPHPSFNSPAPNNTLRIDHPLLNWSKQPYAISLCRSVYVPSSLDGMRDIFVYQPLIVWYLGHFNYF